MFKAIKIKENIYWVGALDYQVRQFHGYNTQRGATYNAYLIIDEKITLIDTVKTPFAHEMIERISSVISPEKIDVIISNHVEMDHSGSLPEILKYCPNAEVVCVAPSGLMGLKAHYGSSYNYHGVKEGETYSIGKHSFTFVPTPLLHWPDNMVTYENSEHILFSNDAFGQHYCTNERFDFQVDEDILMFEAKKYYANILLCYGRQALKAIETVKSLDIDMILPSHGVILTDKCKDKMIANYENWAKQDTSNDALIVYNSMWHSTEKIALAINEELTENGIKTHFYDLKGTHPSDIISDVIDSKYIFVGSPTLNNNMMPTVCGFLCYLKGLSPKNKLACGFGSYGWNERSVKLITKDLQECGFEILDEKGLVCNYIPSNEKLDEIKLKVKEMINK